MEVIYGLLPGMLLLGIIGVAVFFWAVRNGQYDDMDGAANRVLLDDEDDPVETEPDGNSVSQTKQPENSEK
jgi:cbb3-type cytochrome oxidase maturation protein